MLEKYFVKPETIDRFRFSWISDPIERYVIWLTERGYNWRSVSRRVPWLFRFGEFSKKKGAKDFKDLPKLVEPFIRSVLAERRGKSARILYDTEKSVRGPIQQMLRLAVPGFAGRGRSCKPENPFCDQAPHFIDYLQKEKGLREKSVYHYVYHLRRFAAYLKKVEVTRLKDLSPPILSGYLTEFRGKLARASLRNACGVLKVFLRYLYREKILPKDLSGTIEYPTQYKLSGIPRSISWDQVRKMLELVDRRTPIGKRDYAILLLLVTYGLRGREVAGLTLEDIDWSNEKLRVPERKAGHSTAYPLSSVVANAIIEYLKLGRPKTDSRRIFFEHRAPWVPVTYAVVSARASYYLRKAGISVSRPGSHTLRHTCVQRLVDANFSFKVIGDYVGHRSPSSTQIYAKVAVETLREVACGYGEDVL